MSDCGIYGNKNWQRAVDKASDKPAATVHGTGSGEAKCEHSIGVWWKDRPNEVLCSNCNQSVSLPTPPAQSTVTLEREKYNNAIYKMRIVEQCTAEGEARDLAREALALLRAAERQQ